MGGWAGGQPRRVVCQGRGPLRWRLVQEGGGGGGAWPGMAWSLVVLGVAEGAGSCYSSCPGENGMDGHHAWQPSTHCCRASVCCPAPGPHSHPALLLQASQVILAAAKKEAKNASKELQVGAAAPACACPAHRAWWPDTACRVLWCNVVWCYGVVVQCGAVWWCGVAQWCCGNADVVWCGRVVLLGWGPARWCWVSSSQPRSTPGCCSGPLPKTRPMPACALVSGYPEP